MLSEFPLQLFWVFNDLDSVGSGNRCYQICILADDEAAKANIHAVCKLKYTMVHPSKIHLGWIEGFQDLMILSDIINI